MDLPGLKPMDLALGPNMRWDTSSEGSRLNSNCGGQRPNGYLENWEQEHTGA